jgi:hypothetical protein
METWFFGPNFEHVHYFRNVMQYRYACGTLNNYAQVGDNGADSSVGTVNRI